MAVGYRRVLREAANGSTYYALVPYYIPPSTTSTTSKPYSPVYKPPDQRQLLKDRLAREAAAKAAADKKRAEELAKKRAIAAKTAARARMWASLGESAEDARRAAQATLNRTTVSTTGVVTIMGPPAGSIPPLTPEEKAQRKRAQDATNARWAGQYAQWQGTPEGVQAGNRAKNKADVDAALKKNKGGNPAAAKVMERVIREALEGQRVSGGKSLDAETVEAARAGLEKHATQVSNYLKTNLKTLDGIYKRDKKGNVVGIKGVGAEYQKNWRQYKKITGNPLWNQMWNEYDRLFVDKKDPHTGKWKHHATYEPTMNRYTTMRDKQDEILAKQAKEAFLRRATGPDSYFTLEKQWEHSEKWNYPDAYKHMDPTTTSMIYAPVLNKKGKETGRFAMRHRTIQEEFDLRRDAYETQMRKTYAEWLKEYGHQGPADEMRRLMAQPPQKDANDIRVAAEALGMDPKKGPTNKQEVIKIVDKILEGWKKDNVGKFKTSFADLEAKDKGPGGLGGLLSGYSGSMGGASGAQHAGITEHTVRWEDAVEEERKRLFELFHTEAPMDFDTFGIPGLKPFMQVFGGIGALPTTLLRLEAASGGNLLQRGFLNLLQGKGATDGWGDTADNTSKILGNMPTIADVPPEVEAMLREQERKYQQGQIAAQSGVSSSKRGVSGIGSMNARQHAYDEWVATPEGQKWFHEKWDENKAASSREDMDFLAGVYGDTDFFEKMEAISEYGFNFSNNQILNFVGAFGTDPTIALPMNVTTWVARAENALKVTKGMNAFKRVGAVALNFQKVTEPELRFAKTLKNLTPEALAGKNADQVAEDILAEVAGVVTGSESQYAKNAKIKEILTKWGIQPDSTNGHLLLSQVQEVLLKKFADAGIDYRDVAKKVGESEELKRLMAKRKLVEEHPVVQLADRRQAEIKQQINEADRRATNILEQEREQEVLAIEQRIARPVAERETIEVIEREAAGPGLLHVVNESATLDNIAEDPLRRAIGEDVAHRPNLVQDAADIHGAITGARDVVQHVGRQWAPGRTSPDQAMKFTDEVFASDEFARLKAILEAPVQRVRQVTPPPAGPGYDVADDWLLPGEMGAERTWIAGQPLNRPVTDAERLKASLRMDELAAESIAIEKRAMENIARKDDYGRALPPLQIEDMPGQVRKGVKARAQKLGREVAKVGTIPWEYAKNGVAYAVAGGRKAGQQYITSRTDLLVARAGAANPSEELKIAADRRMVEDLKKRLLLAGSRLRDPADKLFGREQFDAELAAISEHGIYRSSRSLTDDMRNEGGQIVQLVGELDYIRAEGGITDFIPVGKRLVDDFGERVAAEEYISIQHMERYYETLSLLPEMMTGPGYETPLMEMILNPTYRAGLTREAFMNDFLPLIMKASHSGPLGPLQFREGSSHLFALFHLSMLDGKSAMLEMQALDKAWEASAYAAARQTAQITKPRVSRSVQATRRKNAIKAADEAVAGLEAEKVALDAAKDTISPGAYRYRSRKLTERIQTTKDDLVVRLHAMDQDYALSQQEFKEHGYKPQMTRQQYLARRKDILSRSNGARERLDEYSKAMAAVLSTPGNEHNMFARMWQVMEKRAGVDWAERLGTYANVNGNFTESIIKGGHELHPNLALSMIPYGPIARQLPVNHGFVGHLKNLAVTMNPLFQSSLPRWNDAEIVAQLEIIANPRARLTSGERVSKATQIVHYWAMAYGSSIRRAAHMLQLKDHSIETSFRYAKAQGGDLPMGWKKLKAAWVEQRAGEYTPELLGRLTGAARRSRVESEAGKEFDKIMAPVRDVRLQSPAKKGGKRRQEFPQELRDLYEEAYWANEVTHDNAGLHTTMFLQKMGDPNFQRGDTWVRYASSYWDHMVAAGAETEARTVLRTVFAPELHRANWDAFEGLTKVGREMLSAVDEGIEVPVGGVWVGSTQGWVGGPNQLFTKAGLLADPERIRAEGKARALDQIMYGEEHIEDAARYDELMDEDGAARAMKEEADAGSSAMYAMASLDRMVTSSRIAADDMTAAAHDLDELELGVTKTSEMERALVGAEAEVVRLQEIEVKAATAAMRATDETPFVEIAEKRLLDTQKRLKQYDEAVEAVEKAKAMVEASRSELDEAMESGASVAEKNEIRVELKEMRAQQDRAQLALEQQHPIDKFDVERAQESLRMARVRDEDIRAARSAKRVDPEALRMAKEDAARLRRGLAAFKVTDEAYEAATKVVDRLSDELRKLRDRAAPTDEIAAKLKEYQQAVDEAEYRLRQSGQVRSGATHRPSNVRMKGYKKEYYRILRDKEAGGRWAANEWAHENVPSDAIGWLFAEVRHEIARKNMIRMLNSVVYRTIDMAMIPAAVGEEMAVLVETIKGLPDGEALLKGWAELYYNDLLRSRLIDYVKHEAWFRMAGQAQVGRDIMVGGQVITETDLSEITALWRTASDKVSSLRKELDEMTRPNAEHKFAEGGEQRLRKALADAENNRDVIAKERNDLIEARKEGERLGQPARARTRRELPEGMADPNAPKVDLAKETDQVRQRRIFKAEDTLPFKPVGGEGWKLHLGFNRLDQASADAITSVLEDLQKRGYIKGYKIGKSSGQLGKDATIYVGAKDASDWVAGEIDRLVGGYLFDPAGDVLTDDIEFTGKVWGRFDTGNSPRTTDLDFHQYGHQGFGAPNLDVQQRQLGNVDPNFSDEVSRRRAFNTLNKTYGDYFRGTGHVEPPARTAVPPRRPSPVELNSTRVGTSQRGLEILQQMTEVEWLERELRKALTARRMAPGGEAKSNAVRREQLIRRALRVADQANVDADQALSMSKRRKFAKTAKSVLRDRAAKSFAPNHITSFVFSAAGLEVEQGRIYNRILGSAPHGNGRVYSSQRRVGAVSKTYVTHGTKIEEDLGKSLSSDLLQRHGFPEDMLSELSTSEFLTNLDEFGHALEDPQFGTFVREFTGRVNDYLIKTTGDRTYSIERWMDDRLLMRDDHFPVRRFEDVEEKVTAAINFERHGARKQTKTSLRKIAGPRPENPLVETVETDIRAVIAKAKVLNAERIDVHAYNEARKVLRGGLVKKRSGRYAVKKATDSATATLLGRGMKVTDRGWKKAFDAEYETEFLAVRAKMASDEAAKLIEELAYNEMAGSTFEQVIEEFERRYSMGGDVKGYEPGAISDFQRRTLEEATKELLGVDDLNDEAKMMEALSRHGQAPPFNNRDQMRDWLVKYGFWSPRTAELIEEGKKSWSIFEEAKFYRDSWGRTPKWADPNLLEEGAEYAGLLYDEGWRAAVYRDWGLFSRNMEARFAKGAMSRGERARFLVEGSLALGLSGRRDLALERRYVIERFGRLANASEDGKTLTAFPELMNREELRQFIIDRTAKGLAIPDGVIQSQEQLDILHQLIDKYVGRYVDEHHFAGKTAEFEDLFELASQITFELMANPLWLNRGRDVIGKFLRGQAAFRRSLVFTQLAFLLTNVIDLGIKGPWTAFRTRAYRREFAGVLSAEASALSLMDFGWKPHGQLLHDTPIHGTERLRALKGAPRRYRLKDGTVVEETLKQKAMADAVQGVLGGSELIAQGAGSAEDFMKLRLAKSMWDRAYAQALRETKDEKLARAATLKFISEEVARMWPTSGNGPLETLFNQISPFASYQFKNRVMFIGEFISHPFLYNVFNNIGKAVEQVNRANEDPHSPLTPQEAHMIELPWAPGVFIDIGAWSDAQRGLKPLYEIINGEATVGSIASQFVRLASANDINFVEGAMNALNFGQRKGWRQIMDENGDPTGEWEEVVMPWEAPWGGDANWLNSFWPVELGKKWNDAMQSGWDGNELTKAAYQTLFFGGIKEHDKGAGLQAYFWALKEKDPKAADAFLRTKDGLALQAYWADKGPKTADWYTPKAILDLLNPPKKDTGNEWLHAQSRHFQNLIHNDLDELDVIKRKWHNIIFELTPGTPEYAEAKLAQSVERYQFIADHPELYEYYGFSMTANEWVKEMDDWVVDDLVDTFFNHKAPDRNKFADTAAGEQKFNDQLRAWKAWRANYLKQFPKVADRLAKTRNDIEGIWRDVESGWFDVLDRVGSRSIALKAAQEANNYPVADQIYLSNELDYKLLDEDVAVSYFDPEVDFKTLGKGPNFDPYQGPVQLKSGPNGQGLLRRVRVLPDFNQWRYARATPLEQAKMRKNDKYGALMKEVIDKAKASGKFGTTFVNLIKADPWLRREYFARNPGTKAKWEASDAYYNQISKFGLLMKSGKFDEGYKYFNALPAWVKERYYAKHPERRQAAVKNAEYIHWMGRWVAYYKKRDFEGGAAFFNKLPAWVKERYYGKNPEGFGRGKPSAYSTAMGKWVKLLQENKDDEAKKFFNSMPKAFRDRYYKKHPDARLRDDIKRTGQLGTYFGADDANRAQFLKDNPEFGKWLKDQGSKSDTRRMLIMAAYQGLEDSWQKRVFREKYPEIFSKEAAGERALAKVSRFLAEHPEYMPAFKRWLEGVMASYQEELKYSKAPPKPLEVIHPSQHNMNRKRQYTGQSAAWVRLHSVG